MPLLIPTLALTFLAVLCVMGAMWLVSLRLRNASIIDPFWGTGFVGVVWVAWSMNRPASIRDLLLYGMTVVWGLRLSLFLLWRNWNHGEDYRYAAMRTYHGERFWWVSLLTVFLLQGVILWFVSLPIQIAAASTTATRLGWLDAVGVALWATGLFFESVGDWQLARFKSDPANAGRVMDRGLWRYTRHPNYFGDFCIWWGLYLVALSGGSFWTIGSPLLMSFLLLKVSGVAMLERTITDRRPEYAAYQQRTNAFFPGRPKS